MGGRYESIWILGGWYGVLAAMLFEDPRFTIGAIDSIDIDPVVGAVAATLNRPFATRFRAATGDMYALDYRSGHPDLTVNTSCEHIADVRRWLDLLPAGSRVLLQSNGLFPRAEPCQLRSLARGIRTAGGAVDGRFLR